MFEAEVLFNDLSAVKSFVSVATKYEKMPINLISDVYTIDAHSLMGIISLDSVSVKSSISDAAGQGVMA